jgi:hypothetical protein
MKKPLLLVSVLLILISGSCKKSDSTTEELPGILPVIPAPTTTLSPAPDTWQEHWFEHVQLVKKVFADTSLVVYFDDQVAKTITWPNNYLAQVWNYTKKNYGAFGTDPRLYAIFHTGKYSGGHPSTYMDASHDLRNVIDCGSSDPNAWVSGVGNDIDITTHEVGHIVEGASRGVHNSPAFPIWHDSKWMEIYQYDVYLGLGRNEDAVRWFNKMQSTADSYPRAGTHWFRDWFYPVYMQYGKTKVLTSFFTLLSKHFPKKAFNNGTGSYPEYTRNLNFGEFIHFWSGAAGTNLKALGITAFGEKDEQGNDWTIQFAQAQVAFPDVKY